ncbi:MAG: thioredoxin [Pirellulales bacterium]
MLGVATSALVFTAVLSRNQPAPPSKSQEAGMPSTESVRRHESHQVDVVTAGSRIESATSGTFDARVLRRPTPVLVDFYADWCGPCQIQGQILEELVVEDGEATVVKVNVDQNADLAQKFGVQALPTLLIFRDGRNVARHVGLATKEQIKAALLED